MSALFDLVRDKVNDGWVQCNRDAVEWEDRVGKMIVGKTGTGDSLLISGRDVANAVSLGLIGKTNLHKLISEHCKTPPTSGRALWASPVDIVTMLEDVTCFIPDGVIRRHVASKLVVGWCGQNVKGIPLAQQGVTFDEELVSCSGSEDTVLCKKVENDESVKEQPRSDAHCDLQHLKGNANNVPPIKVFANSGNEPAVYTIPSNVLDWGYEQEDHEDKIKIAERKLEICELNAKIADLQHRRLKSIILGGKSAISFLEDNVSWDDDHKDRILKHVTDSIMSCMWAMQWD